VATDKDKDKDKGLVGGAAGIVGRAADTVRETTGAGLGAVELGTRPTPRSTTTIQAARPATASPPRTCGGERATNPFARSANGSTTPAAPWATRRSLVAQEGTASNDRVARLSARLAQTDKPRPFRAPLRTRVRKALALGRRTAGNRARVRWGRSDGAMFARGSESGERGR
jgi:hypothetical protein